MQEPVRSEGGGGVRRPSPGPYTHVTRALRLRCPNCGSGDLFRRWVHMKEACPGCGLLLDRGERDYFIGAYTLNFIGAEVFIVLGAAVVLLATWPAVPWDAIKGGLVASMVPVPIFTYP